jgi:hypothetical protein
MQENNVLTNKVNFHLFLRDHVVLQADSKEAEFLLEQLEDDGVLPKTITWTGLDGFTNRLYQLEDADYKVGLHEIKMANLRLVLAHGFETEMFMPPLQPSKSKFRWVAGRSLKDIEPAQLPASVLSFLRCLATITYFDKQKERAAQAKNSSDARQEKPNLSLVRRK